MSRVRTIGVMTSLALITAQLAVFSASVGASSGPGLSPRLTGSHSHVNHHGKVRITRAAMKGLNTDVKKGSTPSTATGLAGAVQTRNERTTAYIEVCRETTDGLTGTFSFTSPSFAGTQSVTVLAGATTPLCARLTQVTAGSISVTEATVPDTVLEGVRTTGPAAALSISGLTATVTIPAGGPENMTQIIFRNAPARATTAPAVADPPATGTLKICKALAAGTTAPSGTLFAFSVSGRSTPVNVAPGTCALLADMPTGPITVTETALTGYLLSDIAFLAGTGTMNVGAASAVATVSGGLTTEVQFTSRATTG